METIAQILESRVQSALAGIADVAVRVSAAADTRFGDYQTNVAMIVANRQKSKPREVAQQILDKLDVADISAPPEIAGAGFINFRIKPEWLTGQFARLLADSRLGVPAPVRPKKFVIDFSSPNVAKPMHIGHIRSTILGDALARIAAFVGHEVVRDNHIGDWGTAFGLLLLGWKHFLNPNSLSRDAIGEMERIYKYVNLVGNLPATAPSLILRVLEEIEKPGSPASQYWVQVRKAEKIEQHIPEKWTELDFSAFGMNTVRAALSVLKANGLLRPKSSFPIHKNRLRRLKEVLRTADRLLAENTMSIREQAKLELVKLQRGDEENLRIWQKMRHLSQREFDAIYNRLGVRFDVTLGESSYNSQLADVVQDLRVRGVGVESNGAVCVFSDGTVKAESDPFQIKDESGWRPNPALVQKSDGGFNYTTTDLATLEYRLKTWSPDEILVLTDGRQQLHFRQLIAIFRRWHPELADKVRMTHVWFGAILGADGKPFKTRGGETVKLAALLDEAEERALALVVEKNPELPDAERR